MPSATNVGPLIRATTCSTFGRARTLRGRAARALRGPVAGLTIFRMGVVQTLSTTPVAGELLERAGDLAALSAALDVVARERRGRLVLVRGEAGAGKTMLVRRFCDGVTGARVRLGACDALFTPRPLGPFADIAPTATGASHEVAALLLDELRTKSPTVVVVEDLHWADEASLDVLRIVARRIATVAALVVLTYRDDELDRRHPLRSLLGELSPVERVLRIDVGPLSPDAVALLAQPYGLDPDDLYRKTGGNAFFVTEVLAAGGAAVPETLRDAVLARASRLTDAARALLETVALLPPHADLWLLEALVPDSAGSLEECLASGMLRAAPGRVVFRHELARLAVEDSLPPDERVAVHRRALAALADAPYAGDDPARLAYHAEAAADREAVLRFAPAAAEQAAALGAHREAADQYARTLRFGGGLDRAERARLLERMATECYLTDRNPEAVAALREALEHHRALGDVRSEGDTLRMLSEYLWCPGRVAESAQAGRQAVALLDRFEPGRELAEAFGNMAHLCRAAGGGEEALAWARRAFELATRIDDQEFRIANLASLGLAEALVGERAGYEKLGEALATAEASGFESQAWIGLEYGYLRLCARSYAAADELLGRSLAYSSEHGLELFRQYALAYRARSELEQARWPAAADLADEVLRQRRASTTPAIVALVVIGLLRARRGDPDPGSPLDEAAELAEMSGELPRIGPVAAAQAEAAWLEGRLESVAGLTAPALRLSRGLHSPWLLGELSNWRRRAGSREQPPADVAEPYRLELAGEPEAAAELWSRLGCRYEAALALAWADDDGLLLRALGDLQRLGGAPAARLVSRRLRERGVRCVPRGPRPATRRNAAGLTGRELEVLRLLADGRRNAAIAERLYVSPRTIDRHVSSLLGKLDARTRGEAVAAARRLGLLQHR